MKKEPVFTKIFVHPTQAKILNMLRENKLNLDATLREIGSQLGIENDPQIVKHHLEYLVKLGALDKISGSYHYGQTPI